MAEPQLSPGVFFIQNLGTGTLLDLSGGRSDDGAKVQGWKKHEFNDPWVPAQLWIIAPWAGSLYTIQNVSGCTYMDLSVDEATGSTRVVCNAKRSDQTQRWTITRNVTGTCYVIKNVATEAYIDLQNGGVTNGTAVNVMDGSGAGTEDPNQLWLIVRA